jgi:hypothetical protein
MASTAKKRKDKPGTPGTSVAHRLNQLAKEERDRETVVVRSQPHRREFTDNDDPMLSTPLGRFCKKTWPNDPDYRSICYNAGNDYAMQVRDEKAARGFYVENLERSGTSAGGDFDEEDVRAAKGRVDAAQRLLQDSRAALMSMGVGTRAQHAVERLVCNDAESDLYPAVRMNDEGLLQAALYRLALHYGMINRGINWSKGC